jgi:predicted lipoprotein with Yx(FWY)xxD motif
MSVFKRAAILTASLGAVALATTACNGYGSSSSAAPAAAATSAAAPQSSAAQNSSNGSAAKAGAALVATTSPLGQIVVSSNGMTLYRFDKDTAKPPTSNCSGACATLWPPATAADTVSLNGVDKSLVGEITRADGTKQLTLNGWPLYTYAGDSKPGDINGQGVGGTWYAVTPTGGKAKGSAADNSGSTSSSGW